MHLSPIDFDIPELKPKKDTILFSKDGSIGIAYKVQSDLNVFTSGGDGIVMEEKYIGDILSTVYPVLHNYAIKKAKGKLGGN